MGVQDIVKGLEDRLGYSQIDYIFLSESSDTIGRIASLILGLMVNLILIIVPLIVSLELIYICMPVFRDKIDKLIIYLEGRGVNRKAIDFTLRDAVEALKLYYVYNQHKSVLWIYFTIKIKSVVVVFFLLTLAVKGSPILIELAWNTLGEVIKSIFY